MITPLRGFLFSVRVPGALTIFLVLLFYDYDYDYRWVAFLGGFVITQLVWQFLRWRAEKRWSRIPTVAKWYDRALGAFAVDGFTLIVLYNTVLLKLAAAYYHASLQPLWTIEGWYLLVILLPILTTSGMVAYGAHKARSEMLAGR